MATVIDFSASVPSAASIKAAGHDGAVCESFHIGPRLPSRDQPKMIAGDHGVISCNAADLFSGIESVPNSDNITFPDFLKSLPSTPPPLVVDVIALSAQGQVPWINAWLVIAVVANNRSGGEFPPKVDHGRPVGIHDPPLPGDASVSRVVDVPSPFPAFFRAFIAWGVGAQRLAEGGTVLPLLSNGSANGGVSMFSEPTVMRSTEPAGETRASTFIHLTCLVCHNDSIYEGGPHGYSD